MSGEETTAESGGRRSGGRRARGGGGASARRQSRSTPKLAALPYIHRQLEPTDILSLEAIEIIETNRTDNPHKTYS